MYYITYGMTVACPGIHKWGGGGQKSERLFFCFSIFQGGGNSENSRENDISDSKSSKI